MKEYKTVKVYDEKSVNKACQTALNREAENGWELVQYVITEYDSPFLILVRDKW